LQLGVHGTSGWQIPSGSPLPPVTCALVRRKLQASRLFTSPRNVLPLVLSSVPQPVHTPAAAHPSCSGAAGRSRPSAQSACGTGASPQLPPPTARRRSASTPAVRRHPENVATLVPPPHLLRQCKHSDTDAGLSRTPCLLHGSFQWPLHAVPSVNTGDVFWPATTQSSLNASSVIGIAAEGVCIQLSAASQLS
jgi:hypothetical protein